MLKSNVKNVLRNVTEFFSVSKQDISSIPKDVVTSEIKSALVGTALFAASLYALDKALVEVGKKYFDTNIKSQFDVKSEKLKP